MLSSGGGALQQTGGSCDEAAFLSGEGDGIARKAARFVHHQTELRLLLTCLMMTTAQSYLQGWVFWACSNNMPFFVGHW